MPSPFHLPTSLVPSISTPLSFNPLLFCFDFILPSNLEDLLFVFPEHPGTVLCPPYDLLRILVLVSCSLFPRTRQGTPQERTTQRLVPFFKVRTKVHKVTELIFHNLKKLFHNLLRSNPALQIHFPFGKSPPPTPWKHKDPTPGPLSFSSIYPQRETPTNFIW